MDISPYVKLMLEKKADYLKFDADVAPRVSIEGQERAVGNKVVTDDMLHEAVNIITNDTQKLQLSINKMIRFVASLLGGVKLISEITEDDEKLSIIIRQDKRDHIEKTQTPTDLSVLGDAPDEALDIMPYLVKMVEIDGSDLFITSGAPVKSKVHGTAIEMDSYLLTPELTQSAAYNIMTEAQIEEFEQTKDLDFAISLPDNSARFRVNVFSQRRSVGMVLRLIPSEIPTA
ncbi:MAG: hypothetical protein JKY76_00530 [Proteobacteria bacterium]|nr:hypothetical protein [Pseudomonadota bacterium]